MYAKLTGATNLNVLQFSPEKFTNQEKKAPVGTSAAH